MANFIFIVLSFSLLLISCKKKPPIEPTIEYIGVSKSFMSQNRQDSMILEFSFVDGDGDLGIDGEDAIFVQDSRDSTVVAAYQIPNYLQFDKKK